MAEVVKDDSLMKDRRVDCWSLMTTMTVRDYLRLVEQAYRNRGGLQHQREPLKATSARRIRGRMMQDIKRGAVLPPLVIGVVVDAQAMSEIRDLPLEATTDKVTGEWADSVAIIDGMQRTTALIDAAKEDAAVFDQSVRIECWIAHTTDSLIYRMLVLNTGQVPWNIKRQLFVVYAPLVKEIQTKVNFERLLNPDRAERRYKAGEYSPADLIEAYLAFGLRRTEIDTQETLADEFSRLDIAESIASHRFDQFFYPIVQMMVNLDRAFARCDVALAGDAEPAEAVLPKFQIGRNIFDSQPARVGFVVASAIAALGRIGMDKDEEASRAALSEMRQSVDNLVEKLGYFSLADMEAFLSLDILSEKLGGQKRSAVGRHERAFFEAAFKVLVEEKFNVPRLEVCWRA